MNKLKYMKTATFFIEKGILPRQLDRTDVKEWLIEKVKEYDWIDNPAYHTRKYFEWEDYFYNLNVFIYINNSWMENIDFLDIYFLQKIREEFLNNTPLASYLLAALAKVYKDEKMIAQKEIILSYIFNRRSFTFDSLNVVLLNYIAISKNGEYIKFLINDEGLLKKMSERNKHNVIGETWWNIFKYDGTVYYRDGNKIEDKNIIQRMALNCDLSEIEIKKLFSNVSYYLFPMFIVEAFRIVGKLRNEYKIS